MSASKKEARFQHAHNSSKGRSSRGVAQRTHSLLVSINNKGIEQRVRQLRYVVLSTAAAGAAAAAGGIGGKEGTTLPKRKNEATNDEILTLARKKVR